MVINTYYMLINILYAYLHILYVCLLTQSICMLINTYCMLNNNNNTIWKKKLCRIAAARADGQRRRSMTCQICLRLPSA